MNLSVAELFVIQPLEHYNGRKAIDNIYLRKLL
jgi:hypothetical protein